MILKNFIRAVLSVVLSINLAFSQNQFERGMIWEDNRYNALSVEYGSQTNLPPARSLKAFYPRVVSQPKMDFTGVAWASVWNARTAAEAIACNQTDQKKITEGAFAPAYNYAIVRKTPDCQSAISIIDLLESMVRQGTPYFSEFREFCTNELPTELSQTAHDKALSGYFKLFNTSDEMNVKVQSVKNAINSSKAVIGVMICPPSFQGARDFWQPHEQSPDPQEGGHAVCVVGYDDTKFGGAFEVVNTWGKDWGAQGFTWIRYKDFADYFPYAFGLFEVGSASCDIPFEASVNFIQINGEEMRVQVEGAEGQYKFWKPYPTGTTFTIQMSTTLPAYVYCFGVDPANDLFPLYPRLATTMPISFTSLRAPDDQPAVMLSDPPGKNNIYFIFSPSAISLYGLLEKLKGRKVITPNDIRVALSVTLQPTKWSGANLSFSARLTAPVIMQVTLEQTKK